MGLTLPRARLMMLVQGLYRVSTGSRSKLVIISSQGQTDYAVQREGIAVQLGQAAEGTIMRRQRGQNQRALIVVQEVSPPVGRNLFVASGMTTKYMASGRPLKSQSPPSWQFQVHVPAIAGRGRKGLLPRRASVAPKAAAV